MSSHLKENARVSEIDYRKLFDTARDAVLVVEVASGKIADSNSSAERLLGLSRNELAGRELWEIGLFTDKEANRSAFQELEADGFLRCRQLTIKTKAGDFREVEFTGTVFAEGESPFVQCSIREIMGRNAAEQSTGRQNMTLLAQIASRIARLGGWTIRLADMKLTWSDENCAIHDVEPGYQPTLEEGISYYPPDCRERVKRYVEACAREGTPYDFEMPKYTTKGRLIWVRSIGEAVRDAEGRIIGLQGAFQDITAQKESEAEKEELIKRLQAALQEVKTLREILPICSYCRKIRDDENFWSQLEHYISENTETKFSHGICPDCYETEVVPQLEQMKRRLR